MHDFQATTDDYEDKYVPDFTKAKVQEALDELPLKGKM